MKNYFKFITLICAGMVLGGCCLPFQSEEYPAWKTNGLIDNNTLLDGRSVDGWQGLNIGETAHTSFLDINVISVEKLNSYNGKDAKNGFSLIHAVIDIKNISDAKQYLSKEDFALMWDLNKNESSYVYSLDSYNDSMLKDNLVILKDNSITIDTVYEINNDIKKPFAIFYGETYADGVDGSSYFFYIR